MSPLTVGGLLFVSVRMSVCLSGRLSVLGQSLSDYLLYTYLTVCVFVYLSFCISAYFYSFALDIFINIIYISAMLMLL